MVAPINRYHCGTQFGSDVTKNQCESIPHCCYNPIGNIDDDTAQSLMDDALGLWPLNQIYWSQICAESQNCVEFFHFSEQEFIKNLLLAKNWSNKSFSYFVIMHHENTYSRIFLNVHASVRTIGKESVPSRGRQIF